MTPGRQKIPPAEAGFALIEVLITAVVVLVASIGTFGLLQAMTRASGEQRHRSQAYAVAQEDQSRLRSMRLTALSNLDEKRPVAVGGTTFTIRSIGAFINNKTSTLSCSEDAKSADYAQVTTVVSWPGMVNGEQTVLRSIVSPSSNSIDSKNGTMTVSVTNEKGEPKAGVKLEAGVFSATSNAEGCANFPNLAAGTHVLSSDGKDANLVNTDSSYEGEQDAGVGAGVAKVTKLTYDSPGTIPVEFEYRVGKSEAFEPTNADSVVAFHGVMEEAKTLGTPGGTRLPVVAATPLFPFTSPYSIYAGSCPDNKPSAGPAMVNVVAPVGDVTLPVKIRLPALDLTVKNGTEVFKGARVTITDSKCKDSQGKPIKRVYTTNSTGKPASGISPEKSELGLPWGAYEVCASATIGANIRKRTGSATVQNLTDSTVLTLDLNGAPTGAACP